MFEHAPGRRQPHREAPPQREDGAEKPAPQKSAEVISINRKAHEVYRTHGAEILSAVECQSILKFERVAARTKAKANTVYEGNARFYADTAKIKVSPEVIRLYALLRAIRPENATGAAAKLASMSDQPLFREILRIKCEEDALVGWNKWLHPNIK